jgi:hypothetical protein
MYIETYNDFGLFINNNYVITNFRTVLTTNVCVIKINVSIVGIHIRCHTFYDRENITRFYDHQIDLNGSD